MVKHNKQSKQAPKKTASDNIGKQKKAQNDTVDSARVTKCQVTRLPYKPSVSDLAGLASDQKYKDLLMQTQLAVSKDLHNGEKLCQNIEQNLAMVESTDIIRRGKLLCPICRSSYDHQDQIPICLPCGHTICRSCVSKLRVSPGRGTCPFDRKDFYQVLDFLPVNYALLDVIGEDNVVKCNIHSTDIIAYCKTHEKILCGRCILDHRNDQCMDLESPEVQEIVDRKLQSIQDTEQNLTKLMEGWVNSLREISQHSRLAMGHMTKHIENLRRTEIMLMEKIHQGTSECIKQATMLTGIFPEDYQSQVDNIISRFTTRINSNHDIEHEFRSLSIPEQLTIELPSIDPYMMPESMGKLRELENLFQQDIDYETSILDNNLQAMQDGPSNLQDRNYY